MNICMVTYNLVNNGIGKVVLTYSAELVRRGHIVTVLVGGPCEEGKAEEAASCGITVAALPDRARETIRYFKALASIFNNERFDIVHIHGNSAMVFPELVVAKRSRAVAVACHCHSTGCEHPVLHQTLKPFVPHLCSCRFACSEKAGMWLFGSSDFTVIPNSFNLEEFAFDGRSRKLIRNSFGIGEHSVVLGNVARLNPEKNHAFLIKVFEAFHREHPDSFLMIAGGGPGEKDVGALVEASPAKGSILLLGNIDNPSKLYSSMDCFVFPSIHEGLGIALVEAQISGLECLVSSGVPASACVSDRFHAAPLSLGADNWAHNIAVLSSRSYDRSHCSFYNQRLDDFDIRSSYRILEDAYETALLQGGHE